MKDYELTVLIHPDLEMNLEPALDKIKQLIEGNGGVIDKESNDGKKRLAYTIGKQDFAVYYFYELKLPSEAPAKISSNLNIADEVLRYLLVVKDERRNREEASDGSKEDAAEQENTKEVKANNKEEV